MIESRNRAGWIRGLVLTAGVALVAVACTTPAASTAPTSLASAGATAGSAAPSTGSTGPIGVSLITKDSDEPVLRRHAEGRQGAADKHGVKLTVASGKEEGDEASQIPRSRTPSSAATRASSSPRCRTGVNGAIKKARDAGLYVIALDTPPDPAETVDITFATDNLLAGRAHRQVGRREARRRAGHDRAARPVQRQDRLGRLRP